MRARLDEAVQFFSQPANERPYLILELAEYLALLDDEDEPKGKLLVKVAAFCADHQGDPRVSLASVASTLNALPHHSSATDDIREIVGRCEWSNTLNHEPDPTGA